MDEKIIEVIIQVIGGLGLFLYGMQAMSDGMQRLAGTRLKKIIGAITNNRIMATLVGVGVTGIVQSSSVTTVMVIGFVNAQIMNLTQALAEEFVMKNNIRINCINPQRTLTPMRTSNFGKEDASTLLTSKEVAYVSINTLLADFTGQIVDVVLDK